MKKNSLKMRFLYTFVLINVVFWSSAGGVSAGLFGSGPSIPSFSQMADEAENRYGFDPNILRRSERKGDYPQVEIFFDKTAPQKGEKVTATALPKYFKNSGENLYYTWFLFHEGDDLDDSKAMEEAKRRAMGIVARGDFDPFLFNTNYSDSNSDPDKDGYEASFGGGDGVGGRDITPSKGLNEYEAQNYIEPIAKQVVNAANITRCYRHNFGGFNSNNKALSNYPGGDLIVKCEHVFPQAKSGQKINNPLFDPTNGSEEYVECGANYDIGNGKFTTGEEECWGLDPTNSDTDGDGIKDEADLAGLGQKQLIWSFQPGDRVGLAVEGTSMVAINEGSIGSVSTVFLSKTITFDCTDFEDENYCVNSGGEIGKCYDEECTFFDCTGDNLDLGEPCTTTSSTPGICASCDVCDVDGGCYDGSAICPGADAVGVCQGVDACGVDSEDELCRDLAENIVGVCGDDKVCILTECGAEGKACQTGSGTLGICTKVEDEFGIGSGSEIICLEEKLAFNDDSLNPYYKILWAGLDVCNEEEVEGVLKEDLIEQDMCEDSDDYGFNYWATNPVFLQNEALLKSNLNFTPPNPQFNVDNNDYSDYITVSSNFTQSDVSDDFIYYIWDIYYCGQDDDDLETCTQQTGARLTETCSDGDILGKCANGIDSSSYAQGLGINSIKFKLDNTFLAEHKALDDQDQDENIYDNFYLKAFLRTKNSKNDSKVGVSSVDIPVVVNDNAIEFFKVSRQSDGSYGFDESLDEICVDKLYDKICPVYPGQIVAAKADVNTDSAGSSTIEAYSWEINGQKAVAPMSEATAGTCSFAAGGCSLGDVVYFPISGSGMELQNISLKAKKTGGEEITSERIIAVAEPMAKIVSNDPTKVWPWVVAEIDSDSVFVGRIGETVSFKAELMPDYLNDDLVDNNISLDWYLNGQKVDNDFIVANASNDIKTIGQNIEFKLDGTEGESLNLSVEVRKEFSVDEAALLENNWGIKSLGTLENKKSITLKKTNSSTGAIVAGNSIQMFTASTLANTPEYFIFIIRTAIVFTLFWAFMFGFKYWFSREINLKK